MKLKALTIEMCPSYSDTPGKYKAEIKYEGQSGSVEMKLDPRVSEALLVCIGATIAKFAHQAALEVEKNIFLSVQEARQLPIIEQSTPTP